MLLKGSVNEHISILHHIVTVYNYNKLMYTVTFQEYLYIAPLHVQLEATKSFSSIIQNGTIPAYMFSSSFLPIILHNFDNRDTGKCSSQSSVHTKPDKFENGIFGVKCSLA